VSEPNYRVEDLLNRIGATTNARYKASERLARHQKLSLWTLGYLAFALVAIPLLQALNIQTGVDPAYMNAAESVLAILVLVYALLVGMEKFVSQTGDMQRGAVELDRLAERVVARNPQRMTDAEYAGFAKEYFDIVEKYESHQPLDYLFTRLGDRPQASKEWPEYVWLWLRAQTLNACSYMHYLVVLAFVAFVFGMLVNGVLRHGRGAGELDLRASTSLERQTVKAASADRQRKAF
jgi:hypothetical protein